MAKVIETILLLSAIFCLTFIAGGCYGINFKPRPEDEIIKLDKREPLPATKDGNFKRGDRVAIIEADGELYFSQTIGELSLSREIMGICGELVLVNRGISGTEQWMPGVNGLPDVFDPKRDAVEKISPKGYEFEFGSARSKYTKCLPVEDIFPLPWANNANLKIGDTIYKLSIDRHTPEKGVISELPVERYGNFRARFGDQKTSTEVSQSDIYSSAEPAKQEDLSPGIFVFHDRRGWAMVVGKRGDKIIIREAAAREDYLVNISKLKILK